MDGVDLTLDSAGAGEIFQFQEQSPVLEWRSNNETINFK